MAAWPDKFRAYWQGVFSERLLRYDPCECAIRQQDKVQAAYALANCGLMEAILNKWTFDNYLVKLNPGCGKALKSVRQFAQGKLSPWLFLSGSVGTGKTHLLVAATGHLTRTGVGAVYWTAHDLYLHLVGLAKSDGYEEAVLNLKRAAVLILDDLGTERKTDFAGDLFHSILDTRYQEVRPTLISSNEPMDAFPPRLRSRLGDHLVVTSVTMKGDDLRKVARP